MKRIVLFVVLTFSSYNLFASEHIKFMGIEVTGIFEDFKDSLEIRGFSYMSSFETLHKFYGKFANEIVSLNILTTPKTKTVCKVIVYFPEKHDWREIKADYFIKKNMFKSKYSVDKDFEFFSSPYEDGDGYEKRALAQDKCNYISFFFAEGGHITVEIDKSAQVKVTYEDKINMDLALEELKSNALKDI